MPTMTKRDELAKLVGELKTSADELDAREAKGGAAATVEEMTELEKKGSRVAELYAEIQQQGRVDQQRKEAQSFLDKVVGVPTKEYELERPEHTPDGRPGDPQGKTFGELFVESEAYGEFRKTYGGRDGVIPESVKGLRSPTFYADAKALVTGLSDTSAGAFVRNDIYGPVTDLIGERELTVYDLVTKGTTDSDTIEYVRVTGKTNNAAPVPEATQAGLPALYNAPTGAEILSGGYKPESGLALEKVTTTVKTLAHWMPMTKRSVSDAGQVRTLVDNFLRYGLNEELEDQILSGAGTGENFQGILNASPLTVGSAGTDIDAVVDAIKAVRVTGRRRPTAMVIHPDDWYSTGFLMAKDSQNRYLIGDPRASIDQLNQIWGLRVVVSEGLAANTALVGDFRFAVLWQREGITLSLSDQHLDYFTRNLIAVLAEMRAGFGVLDPQAFCTITAV